jgi:hypothetical protein
VVDGEGSAAGKTRGEDIDRTEIVPAKPKVDGTADEPSARWSSSSASSKIRSSRRSVFLRKSSGSRKVDL